MFFQCSDCGERFPVEAVAGASVARSCPRCGRPQRLHWLAVGPGPLALVLAGCQFSRSTPAEDASAVASPGDPEENSAKPADELPADIDWEEVEQVTGPRVYYETTDELLDPFQTAPAGQWTVTSAVTRKKYVFHYLGIMRKWVLDGVLSGDDLVLLADGSQQPLKTYGPLAELFDPQKASQLKRQYQSRKAVLQRQELRRTRKKRYGRRRWLLWMLALLSAAFLAAELSRAWRLRQDRQVMAKLLSGHPPSSLAPQEAIQQARQALAADNQELFPRAQDEILRQLQSSGEEATLLSYASLLIGRRAQQEQDAAAAQRGLALARLAQRQQPVSVLPWLALAQALLAGGQSQAAENRLRRAEELAADDPWALRLAGRMQRQRNQLEVAAADFAAARRLAPQDVDLAVDLADLYLQQGKTELAQVLLEENLTAAPQHWPSLSRLAQSLQQSGHLEDAERRYRQLLALRPEEQAHYLALAQIATARREYQKVLDLAQAYAAVAPLGGRFDAEMRALREQALQKQDELQRADELRQRQEEQRRDAPRRSWRGRVGG